MIIFTEEVSMKSVIVYATKTGFVTECVDKLCSDMKGDVDKINIAGKIPENLRLTLNLAGGRTIA